MATGVGQSKQGGVRKLRFYVSVIADDMVMQGEEITAPAREYYLRLQGLFLRTGAGSVVTLNRKLVACKYQNGEESFEWLARLDSVYAQFRAVVADLEKKHRRMQLIFDAPIWGFMALLLGCSFICRMETGDADKRGGA